MNEEEKEPAKPKPEAKAAPAPVKNPNPRPISSWSEPMDVSKMDDPWSKRKVAATHDNSR
jgi:hypothetical protein